MTPELEKNLKIVYDTLEKEKKYQHAANILNYDMETICPPKAMEEQGETMAFLTTEAYKLTKSEEFIRAAEYLYANRFGSGTEEEPGEDALCPEDRLLAEYLHKEYGKTKNLSPELNHEFTLIRNKAYVDWFNAKNASDYGIFLPSLKEVIRANETEISLREERTGTVYDGLLDDYERGITQDDLDECFGRCKERLLPLLEKIKASGKVIRTDFMSRPVKDEQQKAFATYLLNTIGYDFERGAFTTTEHPFTDEMARNDVRVTTHYHPDAFAASMYSIVHEGGHALFGQLQPARHHDHHIANRMTMGMHESVSRFYENRIGRSEPFISLIYDKAREIFPGLLDDVSKRELYEAVNLVKPSLIRTEADEFTYTFHIIIRYEIERMIFEGKTDLKELPALWNEKYEKYLGIRPQNDREGILQDVHWSFGFGYFPTYALGNMYNAMYINRLKQEMDLDSTVSAGDFAALNGWMAEHVFARAGELKTKDWIREITGREFTPDDYLDYLEEKYGALYGL